MQINNPYQLTPIGSISFLSEQDIAKSVAIFNKTPEKLRDFLSSSTTGMYIAGTGKKYKIPDIAPIISQQIFFTVTGSQPVMNLSKNLAENLHLDLDTALKIAGEIDQDLFAPIQSDLDAFWAQQSSTKSPISTAAVLPIRQTDSLPKQYEKREGAAQRTSNVLNLKELVAKPDEKELPPKPVQKKLVSGSRTVDLSRPLPPPLTPPRAGGETTAPLRPTPPSPIPPKRTFPLPPSHRQ